MLSFVKIPLGWYTVSMLKIIGNDIYRAEEKIGWIDGNHIYAHDGKKLGYFDSGHVYNADTDKVAYIEGDELLDAGGSRKAHLEEVSEAIEGIVPMATKCAIYVLLGS